MTPSNTIDHVVANAGIAIEDEVFSYDGNPSQQPPNLKPIKQLTNTHNTGPEYPSQPPNLKTVDVNLHGTLYTTKLAFHTFIKQNGSEGPSESQKDTTLTLIGSGAAFLDCPRGVQYQSTKWGIRGIMHGLRRTAHYHGSRVNMISPWLVSPIHPSVDIIDQQHTVKPHQALKSHLTLFPNRYVRTSILPTNAFDHVESAGVSFATLEDGGKLLLRLMSDSSINGRQMFLAPRKWAPSGYLDLDLDDFGDGTFLTEVQRDQMKGAPVDEGLFLRGRW
jgi:NAD(P)-dependent dehydrogenase (short-subunit alcohol dehydrogenase family)